MWDKQRTKYSHGSTATILTSNIIVTPQSQDILINVRDYPAKFEGLIISILSFICSPPDTRSGQSERDKEEKHWIHRLSIVVPRGLNLLD